MCRKRSLLCCGCPPAPRSAGWRSGPPNRLRSDFRRIGMMRAPSRNVRTMFAANSGWGKTSMVRLNKKLNPSLTGNDAEKLNTDLRKRVVGQEEAIDQI